MAATARPHSLPGMWSVRGHQPGRAPLQPTEPLSDQLQRRLRPKAQGGPPAAQGLGARPSLADIHKVDIATLKHVPKRARAALSRTFARCLANAATQNAVAAWTGLQLMANAVLCLPPRAGREDKTALAAFTLDRLARWGAGERLTLWQEACARNARQRRRRQAPTTEQRAARAAACAAEGFWGKGCAALTSGGLAEPTQETARALGRLHPPAAALPLGRSDQLLAAPKLTPNSTLRALRAFPKGTAPSPSGLRAQTCSTP